MPSVNAIKVSIGKESVAGTAVARAAVLPIRGAGSVDRKIERMTDPVIIGTGMDAGEHMVQANVSGSLPLSPRACSGFGMVLAGALGDESVTPQQIVGAVRIKYTGSSASCRLAIDATAKTISALTGALGAEAADTSFGAAGVIDLDTTGYDTVGELVSAIDGYANYECKKITGNDANTATGIMVLTGTTENKQAKDRWAVIILTGTNAGVYAHRLTPDLDISAERPTFSLQFDGWQDNFLRPGAAVKSLNLNAALKGLVESDVEFLGMTEAGGQTASVLALPDAKPFTFSEGVTSLSGNEYDFTRDVSVAIANNLREDGYGQASFDRAFHQKGKFSVSGSLTVRLDATSLAERAKRESGALGQLYLFFKGKAIAAGVDELMILSINYASISEFEFAENSEIFDAKPSWKAFSPAGAYNYDPAIEIVMVSTDSGAY